MNTMLNAYEEVPQLIYFSDAATHDHTFLSKAKLQPRQIPLFDKTYVDYKQYAAWTKQNIFFVTRLKDNTAYEELVEINIYDRCLDK